MALKQWEVLLILFGGLIGLIGLFFIYRKVDSGLERPTDVSTGFLGNEHFWGWEEKQKPRFTHGGKRKRKLRRKPRR
jgi:hypothetical protein